jgi:creatinine amidohydrolase/Fe(II)-dependent formamide hydrolase-like protein
MRNLLLLLLLLCTGAGAQVLNLAEMNTEQIRALDRARTVVLLTGGILEEHGPYLPAGTDALVNDWLARRLAEAIVARPGWTVVRFPLLSLGASGANDIGSRFRFPGTFVVRGSTLRSVYMDLAGELGEQGFRRVFVVDWHGAPVHHRALNDASDFFSDTYGGTMVHLFGINEIFLFEPKTRFLSEEQAAEEGFTVHAGAMEHSAVLFLRPDLVSPDVARAPSITGKDNITGLIRLAEQKDWPGYFGAPRFATAAQGAVHLTGLAEKLTEVALAILDGKDHRALPRYADQAAADPGEQRIEEAIAEHERAIEQKQQEWLRKRVADAR